MEMALDACKGIRTQGEFRSRERQLGKRKEEQGTSPQDAGFFVSAAKTFILSLHYCRRATMQHSGLPAKQIKVIAGV